MSIPTERSGRADLRDLHNPARHHMARLRIRELIRRSPITIFPDASLRDAANEMIRNDVGRLVVVERGNSRKAIGIVTRSDLLLRQRSGLDDMILAEPDIPCAGSQQNQNAGLNLALAGTL